MAFSFILDLWNKWNIRGFVILSLLIQVFLILFAPLRKKIANPSIIFLLWLAYLLADWIAAFAIGLISHNQCNSSTPDAEVNGALQAFWASFLLLHLGGLDTITAFSQEDSSLWRRHLLSFIFQVSATFYVFVQIFPNDKLLVIPTMLVFLAALIKNVERTLALNLSSLPRVRERVLLHHQYSDAPPIKLVEDYNDLGEEYSEGEEVKLAESIVVKHAYHFFNTFDVFLADLIYTNAERNRSHIYFNKVSALDALRVISVELHFYYEMLHTKALTIHSKWSYIFCFIAFIDVAIAFTLFNHLKKRKFPDLDVEITYSLLFGGVALDMVALFMLVFSDWTVAHINWDNTSPSKLHSFLRKFVSAMLDLRKPRFASCKAKPHANVTYEILDTPLIFRRWSESISACNLFSESLKESPRKMHRHNQWWGVIACSNICNFTFRIVEKIISCFHQANKAIARGCDPRSLEGKRSMIMSMKYVSKNPFMMKLWIFIFEEVKRKSKNVHELMDVQEIVESRGALFIETGRGFDGRNLLNYVTGANYNATILQWHIATEIWYNKDKVTAKSDEREFSKILSDYMFYLLLNQPNVMSAVAGIAQIISMQMFFEIRLHINDDKMDVESLCNRLFDEAEDSCAPHSTETHKWRIPLKGGINLAQEMESLGEMKWKVMSGVWVEILSYAASHIKGEAHMQVLSKGGELLTFVWLLMIHFGCFYTPEFGICYESWWSSLVIQSS